MAANGLKSAGEDNKVSKKLLMDYLENIKDVNNEPQVNNGLEIKRFRLYANNEFDAKYMALLRVKLGGKLDTAQLKHDIVVSQQDSQKLADRISATTSVKLINLTNFHHGRGADSILIHKDFIDDVGVFLNED